MTHHKEAPRELVNAASKPLTLKWSDGTMRRYATAQERDQAMRAWRSDFRAARDVFDAAAEARA